MRVYSHILTCAHTHNLTHTHTLTHIHTRTCTHACTHTHVLTHTIFKRGMEQEYNLGKLLQKRYINETGFLARNYTRNQVQSYIP